jgi:predicted SAM-dependent methyltransferase
MSLQITAKGTAMNRKLKNVLKKIPGLRAIAKSMRLFFLKTKSFFQWKKLAKKDVIKLELGSGAKKGTNGFTTVDIYGADIHRDLRLGIPLKNNTVSAIYTSHMLEHIPYQQLIPFLKECLRVLKTGGSISVCVPNSRNYIQAYIEKRNFRLTDDLYQPAVVDTESLLDQVNYIAYMAGQHCYMFDEENLVNTLRKAGFNSVSLRTFNEAIDLRDRDFESIYAIAIK